MAIPKTFTAGERLFAADLNDNFVASDAQGVRVFADAAARTTGIPTPAEGMLTFNKDTGQLEVFDGTNFVVAAPPQNLVAVHSVTKSDTFTVSTAERVPVTVTGLELSSIGMAAASNKLIIAVFIGALASSSNQANVGIRVERDGGAVITGAPALNRVTLTSFQQHSAAASLSTAQPTIIGVFSPGVTTAADFKVRILNMDTTTRTLFVNRTEADADTVQPRMASTFTILEVRA